MHNFIHNKGGAGHISRIFHQRNTKIENENVGEKDNHTPYSSYNSIDDHILQRSVVHVSAHKVSKLLNHPYNSLHRVLAQYESSLKHQEHEKKKNGISPETMRYNRVDHLGGLLLLQMVVSESLFQSSADKSIFGICYSRFAFFTVCLFISFRHFIAHSDNFVAIGQLKYQPLYILIILQQFNGKKTGGIFMTDRFILRHLFFHGINRFLQIGSVINMDMPENPSSRLMRMRIIFRMLFFMMLAILQ